MSVMSSTEAGTRRIPGFFARGKAVSKSHLAELWERLEALNVVHGRRYPANSRDFSPGEIFSVKFFTSAFLLPPKNSETEKVNKTNRVTRTFSLRCSKFQLVFWLFFFFFFFFSQFQSLIFIKIHVFKHQILRDFRI